MLLLLHLMELKESQKALHMRLSSTQAALQVTDSNPSCQFHCLVFNVFMQNGIVNSVLHLTRAAVTGGI